MRSRELHLLKFANAVEQPALPGQCFRNSLFHWFAVRHQVWSACSTAASRCAMTATAQFSFELSAGLVDQVLGRAVERIAQNPRTGLDTRMKVLFSAVSVHKAV